MDSLFEQSISKDVEEKLGNEVYFLIRYYQRKGLTIFGFTDFEKRSFRNGLLNILSKVISSDRLEKTVVDFSSPVVNHPHYLDYMLDGNLTLEEVGLAKMYGNVRYLERWCSNHDFPLVFSKLGKLFSMRRSCDKSRLATDLLRDTKEPVFIYSCGGNVIADYIGFSSFDYLKAKVIPGNKVKYYQMYSNMIDTEIVSYLIEQVRTNFEHIYAINPNTDIIAYGCRVPKSYMEELEPFRDAFLRYNEAFRQLCYEYNVTYVDVNQKYKSFVFQIINSLYDRKLVSFESGLSCKQSTCKLPNNSIDNVILAVNHELNYNFSCAQDAHEFSRSRYKDEATKIFDAKVSFERVKRYYNSSWKRN